MKKFSILLIALALILVAAGCGKKNSESGASGGDSDVVIRVGTDASYAPMENMDKDKIVGFDVDFLDAVMKEAGLSYKLENSGWDPLFIELDKGSSSAYDAGISAVSITDDRKQTYDFSIPYYESRNMILTREDSTIQSALDLKDKKVAVQGATTADDLMKSIMGETNTNLKRFDSNTLALMELQNKGVDAVVADNAIVLEYVKNNPDQKFKTIEDKTNFAPEYYGIIFPKGSDLKAKLDPAIEKVRSSDTYKEIYKKWLGTEPDTTTLLQQK
ncbi:basic amino acid ABC transporter substrate-binding protein [Cohnella lubricantis]|uniref:Basic amino acid ABC transporter substrate-binding protein n=1 Tax=Cohnella lubricantis TaxID=2163172 RepID=A0A841TF76_9BACL|nr:basic amino acid ABC transporter substrate-binding protein [Cohnella lubricantis]MBB6678619.1 basic amino acid ABC transporter substrate-binding protein [Cohnella lubricantis]MBP2119221.1 polar amino acid transport system substrate-binding protein [Cohnella lubricantis]